MLSLMAMLGLDGRNFASKLNEAESNAEQSGKNIKDSLGGSTGGFLGGRLESLLSGLSAAAIAASFVSARSSAMEFGTEVRKTAIQLGVSVEAAQILRRTFGDAADTLPQTFGHLATAMEKVNRHEQGSEKIASAFERMGVSMDVILSENIETVFDGIAENIKKSVVNADKLSDIVELLGRGGSKMVVGFKKGMGEVGQQMRDSGSMLTDFDVEILHGMEKSHSRMMQWLKVKKAQTVIGLEGVAKMFFRLATFRGGNSMDGLFPEVSEAHKNVSEDREQQRKLEEERVLKAAKAAEESKAEAAKQARQADWTLAQDINSKTADMQEKTRQRFLSDEQKKQETLKKRADLMREINSLIMFGADFSKIARKKLELAQLNDNLAEADTKKKPEEKLKHIEHIDVNQLQRIGAFAANPNLPVTTRIEGHVRKIAEHIQYRGHREGKRGEDIVW